MRAHTCRSRARARDAFEGKLKGRGRQRTRSPRVVVLGRAFACRVRLGPGPRDVVKVKVTLPSGVTLERCEGRLASPTWPLDAPPSSPSILQGRKIKSINVDCCQALPLHTACAYDATDRRHRHRRYVREAREVASSSRLWEESGVGCSESCGLRSVRQLPKLLRSPSRKRRPDAQLIRPQTWCMWVLGLESHTFHDGQRQTYANWELTQLRARDG